MMRAPLRILLLLAIGLSLSGCLGAQSALAPTGVEAGQISLLFWGMTGFLGLVMLGVLVVLVLAARGSDRLRALFAGERWVLGAGLVFPIIALSVLFVWGLLIMSSRADSTEDPGALRVSITGEQWWWRVTYRLADGTRLHSANELRIPVGVPVVLDLETADVLHSFWVPNLAGKLDMIPGRTNRLTLTATEPGISRGQCAEYCGGAHAFMSFHVVALMPDAFAEWLEKERGPAVVTEATAATTRGAELFRTLGCGGCHAVRGTDANGVIGPDLTHVGGRLSLAAATLPNNVASFIAWIEANQHIKPGNKMPPYDILTEDELAALALYLEALE